MIDFFSRQTVLFRAISYTPYAISSHSHEIRFTFHVLPFTVFEGEFRDGGLIQLAFAEGDQSQVLIVGRLI